MKKIIVALCCILSSLATLAQTPQAIVAEGKMLYRSEAASWYGTDVFLEKLKSKSAISGGYFSYSEKGQSKCVFFSKGDAPKTVAVISFDSTYNVRAAGIDTSARAFTPYETDLYIIRKKALDVINSDTLFRKYRNSSLNIIPLIDKSKNQRKVYVITGPSVANVVIFGNDYRIDFDAGNNIVAKSRLHKNIIPLDYGKGEEQTAGLHSHLPSTGEYITATDICTLMLYEKYPGWKQYYVISPSYVSIWSCEKNELVVLTKKAWDKISEDQKKRHPEPSKP
jgi:hypothetical protein